MIKLLDLILKWLSCPVFVCAGIVAVSVFSLGSALVAEYAFGLLPCVLCIYQRIPFIITTILGLTGIAFAWQNRKASALMIALAGVTFLINSVIAFYHTGVEQHWWVSAFEGCTVAFEPAASGNILDAITKTQAVPCDQIPWADPVFGLSMANYNAIMCFGLAIGCFFCAWLIRRTSPEASA